LVLRFNPGLFCLIASFVSAKPPSCSGDETDFPLMRTFYLVFFFEETASPFREFPPRRRPRSVIFFIPIVTVDSARFLLIPLRSTVTTFYRLAGRPPEVMIFFLSPGFLFSPRADRGRSFRRGPSLLFLIIPVVVLLCAPTTRRRCFRDFPLFLSFRTSALNTSSRTDIWPPEFGPFFPSHPTFLREAELARFLPFHRRHSCSSATMEKGPFFFPRRRLRVSPSGKSPPSPRAA